MIKHGKLDGARLAAGEARYHLDRFARELDDVQMHAMGIDVDVGGFATFADYFLDGLLFDWVVQSKIGSAKDQVNLAIADVEGIMDALRERGGQATRTLADLQRRRAEFLGST